MKDNKMEGQVSLVPFERIERAIIVVRGEKVMLDSDLAEIYGVETKRLNEQVRRNPTRFPPDFMFQLTAEETANLRSQGDHYNYVRLPAKHMQRPLHSATYAIPS